MKTPTKTNVEYTYDSQAKSLTIWVDGKPRGGFRGDAAQRQMLNLNDDAILKFTDMDTKNIHASKVRTLRALWIKQGIDQHREAILEAYNVTSTTALSDAQLEELIAKYRHTPPANDEIRRLRSEVLTVLNKLGIYVDNNDWSHVNNYLMDKRIAGKLMYQMDACELSSLSKKLRSILRKKSHSIKINQSLN